MIVFLLTVAYHLRPRRSAATRKRLVNASCYVALHEPILPVKQEASSARIYLCEHGDLLLDHSDEPVRSSWP